jgi:hypothetical protein
VNAVNVPFWNRKYSSPFSVSDFELVRHLEVWKGAA